MTGYEVYYETIKKDHPTLNVDCFKTKPIQLGNLVVIKGQLEKGYVTGSLLSTGKVKYNAAL